jgi:bacillithiol biosynthesis deacetylase BshB1
MSTVDVLAIAAHPDDVEITCGGFMIRMADLGYTTGILNLTRGEMGTKGTPETRLQEAADAAKIMKLSALENGGLPDGRLALTDESRALVAGYIRKLRPRLAVIPPGGQRHPDHNVAGEIAYAGIFAAGLKQFPADDEPHRPERILYAASFHEQRPSFYVDITDQFERKLEAVAAYTSQFAEGAPKVYVPDQDLQQFMTFWARAYGSRCGVKYAEAFAIRENLRIDDPIAELRLKSI